MRLIDDDHVLTAFAKHVSEASAVDIAVAWVAPGRHLEILRNAARNNGVKVRVVTGLAGNATVPAALRSIMDFGKLRIADGQRLFHPKFYLFHKGSTSTVWVGSANFTSGGFARNAELLAETQGGDDARQWFTQLWKTLPTDPQAAVADYTERYEPPTHSSDSGDDDSAESDDLPSHPIDLLEPMPKSWSAYMTALRTADRWWRAQGCDWSVLGPFRSYVHTISSAAEVIHRTNWNDLTIDDADILLSTRKGRYGAYGLLGNMGQLGRVKQAFRGQTDKDLDIRQSCRTALAKAAASQGEDFYAAAHNALRSITSFEGFGAGVATRLLTLACPARAVSVNAGSAVGLGRLFKLPGTVGVLGAPDTYVELLRCIHNTAWYRAPMPSGGFEQEVWGMRAALLDAFVYQAE